MTRRENWIRALLLVVASTLAAVGASLIVELWLPPAPVLHHSDFRMDRVGEDAYEVSPGHPLSLPLAFGDYDLLAEIELAEDSDLDLLLRQVEPVRRGSDLPLFHARFAVVRASTRGEGQVVWSREAALFDGDEPGGLKLAAGRQATVVLEARGREIRGNIAGRPVGPFVTTDAHGSLAFACRHGKALVRSLHVRHRPRPAGLLPISWAVVGGVLLGLTLLGVGLRRALASLLVVPAVAALGGLSVLRHLLPECEPNATAIVMLTLAGAPTALVLARLRPLPAALLGVVAVLGLFEAATRIEQPRLGPFEDLRLDAYFGWGSGSAPADALMPRLRARRAVHVPTPERPRYFMLGGDMLFEGVGDLDQWVGVLAAAEARSDSGEDVEGVIVPTIYSHALQQLALFQRYYLDSFAPRGLIFVVPPSEGEDTERADPRAVLDGEVEVWSGGLSAFVALWQAELTPDCPTTDAAGLRRTLLELGELVRERELDLLLVSHAGLREDLAAVVADVAFEQGIELRHYDFFADPQGVAAELAEWIEQRLSD